MTDYIYLQPETGIQCECFSIRGVCNKEYFAKCVKEYLAQYPSWIIFHDGYISQFGIGECCTLFQTKIGFYNKFVQHQRLNLFLIPQAEQIVHQN